MNTDAVATTVATSLAGAVTTLLVWGLSLAHVDVPSSVQAALMIVLASGGHHLTVNFPFHKDTSTNA